jgi:hypothetical protein
MNLCCRLIAAAMAALCLCSCATPYRPLRAGKGFADSQIAPDQFLVSFKGNGQTSLERAYDFLLLRATEVSLQHGFPYFAVMDVTNTSSASRYTVRQQFYTDSAATGFGPVESYGSRGGIVEVEEPHIYFQPGATLLVKCFTRKPDKPFTYEAAVLGQSLRRKNKMR